MPANIKYRALLQTVSQGSFTAAAKGELQCTQSAVSRMIADLESAWGITLLERGKSGVRLTPNGQEVLPYVQRICAAEEGLDECVDNIKGLVRGRVRIGAFSSAAALWLPKVIDVFRLDYPNIDYELVLGKDTDLCDQLAQGTLDFALTTTAADPKYFKSVCIHRDELVCVYSQYHELSESKDPISAKELLNQFIDRVRAVQTGKTYPVISDKGHIVFRTNNVTVLLSLVEKGLGAAIIPSLLLSRTGFNILHRTIVPAKHIDISLTVGRNAVISQSARRFLRYLSQVLQDELNSSETITSLLNDK